MMDDDMKMTMRVGDGPESAPFTVGDMKRVTAALGHNSGATSVNGKDNPSHFMAVLGLQIDCTRYNSPAIVGPTGKLHYLDHGRGHKTRNSMDILERLAAMRKINPYDYPKQTAKHCAPAWWDNRPAFKSYDAKGGES